MLGAPVKDPLNGWAIGVVRHPPHAVARHSVKARHLGGLGHLPHHHGGTAEGASKGHRLPGAGGVTVLATRPPQPEVRDTSQQVLAKCLERLRMLPVGETRRYRAQ